MKKMILMLAVSLIINGAFANEENVDPKVLEAFQKDFASAKDVSWVTYPDYAMARFTFNDQHITAYYRNEGELIGFGRFITSNFLPINLQVSLKQRYNDYWITNLFEVTKDKTISYYITLENAGRIIKLKAAATDDYWDRYKKEEKD